MRPSILPDPSIYRGLAVRPWQMATWHSDHPIFAELVRIVAPRLVIEVGTWLGGSALVMAEALKVQGTGTLLCIDTWLGSVEFYLDPTPARDLNLRHGHPDVYEQFISNVVIRGHDTRIQPWPMPSRMAAQLLQARDVTADLIYLDGSHEPRDVTDDLCAYWPRVRPGGVLFGDDYHPAWPSVTTAVNTFARTMNLRLTIREPFWMLEGR